MDRRGGSDSVDRRGGSDSVLQLVVESGSVRAGPGSLTGFLALSTAHCGGCSRTFHTKGSSSEAAGRGERKHVLHLEEAAGSDLWPGTRSRVRVESEYSQ